MINNQLPPVLVAGKAPKRDLFPFLFIGSWLLVSLMMANSLLGFYRFGTFAFEGGEFHADRCSIFSLCKATEDRGINFLDPYTRQDKAFYQFVVYWIVGLLARVFDVNSWMLGNILQLFYTPLLFPIIFWIGKTLTGNRGTALGGTVLTFFFGHLEFLQTGTLELNVYGDHGVVLEFSRQLGEFNADDCGLVFGYFAFFCFLKLASQEPYGRNWKRETAFLVSASIAFVYHFLTAFFFLTLCFCLLAGNSLGRGLVPLRSQLVFWTGGMFYLLLMVITNFRPGMGVIFIFGTATIVFFYWYSRQKPLFFLLALSVIPLFAYSLINIYVVYLDGGDPFSLTSSFRSSSTAIPLHVYLVSYLPLLFLSGAYIFFNNSTLSRWSASALLNGIFLTTFNHVWGYNNHPYRFMPYSVPLLSLFAAQGLFFLWQARKRWSAVKGLVLVTVLLLGIGTANYYYYYYYYFLLMPRYHWNIPAEIKGTAKRVEDVRKKGGDPIFLVLSDRFSDLHLAPNTSARFFSRNTQKPPSLEFLKMLKLLYSHPLPEAIPLIKKDYPKINYILIYDKSGLRFISTKDE